MPVFLGELIAERPNGCCRRALPKWFNQVTHVLHLHQFAVQSFGALCFAATHPRWSRVCRVNLTPYSPTFWMRRYAGCWVRYLSVWAFTRLLLICGLSGPKLISEAD